MLHLLAFYASVANGTAFRDVAGIVDDVIGMNSSHFVYTRDLRLMAAYIMSATMNRGRVTTPSLRVVGPPLIRPVTVGTAVPTDPNLAAFFDSPLLLPAAEEIAIEAVHDNVGAEDVRALLWVSDGFVEAPPGDVITVRGTGTTAAVANAWTTVSLTWDTVLPGGTYCVLGSEAISANGIAHRWSFDSQSFRPGGLSLTALGNRTHPAFAAGTLGEWGRFPAQVPPRLQVLCSAADAVHTVYLQIVRVG